MGDITDAISTGSDYASLSDEEIIARLCTYTPVNPDSEKNVWAYWDKGLVNAPAWNQRNVVSWVRRLGPSWTVRVLDIVGGSPTHVSKYVDDSYLPKAFLDKDLPGPHAAASASDLVRLPLLYQYGGVWIDVGLLLFRSLDALCWDALTEPGTSYELAGFAVNMGPEVGMIFNGFIAARKGCICAKYWHDILLEAWRHTNSISGMSSHPLLRHLPRYEPPSRNGKMPPFRYAQFADYLSQVFALERLRHLTDPETGWNGPEYFDAKVLLFDCVSEVYWAERLTNWDGKKQFELLGQQREGAVEEDGGYKEADAFVSGILSKSSTMKISHGLPTAGRVYLAELWDKPENADADRKPGSFAAYLRWASEHFEQTLPLQPVKMPLVPGSSLTGGILTGRGKPREEEGQENCADGT
ncbi:uncharacterized protein E0L32_000161 [Thyridium curvatum]|uniref:Capsule polysaccharide biosynthesis protein n=1 Tax=Thyridium curvatum TaxID=1093900 RepID=A0A507B7Q4_9PEZI|nr:uncharacterized protein E0L32_000161 [Thyridium curvatum]TPX15827.1 hypothetical protein E0L32_000161 [Thyridium curvatum]